MKIAVLGAGLVGQAIVNDLAGIDDFTVVAADQDVSRLESLPDEVVKIHGDLTKDEHLERVVAESEIIVNAVPGSLGFRVLKKIIEFGKNVVDIAFFPEDMKELDSLARKHGVTVVCDMGIAPGMSNILAAYAAKEFHDVERIDIYVGGLPVIRRKPYEYKAPFSPADVLEEYTRPARLKINNQIVTKAPLTDYELVDFENIGTLEAFNTDGLRSLLDNVKANNMTEKTLRYPGYAGKIQLLKQSGFFDEKPVEIDGAKVRPIDFTSRLLFPLWELKPGERDMTVMRVHVSGSKNNKQKSVQWNLFDEYDISSGVHSMARTTGYAATGAVKLIAEGDYTRKGVSAPEHLAEKDETVRKLLDHLEARNVVFRKSEYAGV